jgi:hypothetical protein
MLWKIRDRQSATLKLLAKEYRGMAVHARHEAEEIAAGQRAAKVAHGKAITAAEVRKLAAEWDARAERYEAKAGVTA